ncbi:MAG TPA: hypothetical protein PKD78_07955, partial [Saprospiraceae bacterium]|nr:hypothetical protein [Saprospiraceae bacterium]
PDPKIHYPKFNELLLQNTKFLRSGKPKHALRNWQMLRQPGICRHTTRFACKNPPGQKRA